jgi:hypothetical protein
MVEIEFNWDPLAQQIVGAYRNYAIDRTRG